MKLEDELREALRREPAPDGFAARVLARASAAPWWKRPATLALAAGLTVAALIPPAIMERHQRERERALDARNQLRAALAITRTQLEQTREKIRRNTRHVL